MKTPIPLILFTVMIFAGPVFPETGEYFYERGMIEYEGKQYKFAQEDMERAIEEDPKLFRAVNILADLSLKRQKPVKALAYYRQSLEINDAQPDIHYETGKLCEFFYDSTNAVTHFTKAVTQNPDHRYAHLALVRHLLASGERKSADEHFAASHRLGKKTGDPFIEKARREERKGKTAEALSLYEKAIEENPADLDTYFLVSELSQRLRDYRRAVECVQKAVRIRPDLEKGYVHLANLFFTQHMSQNKKLMLELAVKSCEKALELNPNNVDTLNLLSEIYRFTGAREKADEYEKKAERAGKGEWRQ